MQVSVLTSFLLPSSLSDSQLCFLSRFIKEIYNQLQFLLYINHQNQFQEGELQFNQEVQYLSRNRFIIITSLALLEVEMETQKMLEKVGDRNKYQIYSIIFVSAKWLIVSLMVFLPSYLFITPTFTCGTMTNVKEIDACQIIDTCTIQQPYTITNYADLYCDNLFVRNSIISAQFVGSVVGLIILSILADKLGRKVIIVTTLFLSTLGTTLLTIGAHFKIIPLIYIGIIMMGFGGYSLTMVSFSFLSEVSCDKWRQRSLILTYAFWAVGEILLYPIISYLTDWLYICLFIFVVPLSTLFLMSLFLSQTPEFYFVQKRYDECLQSLNYIAKFNGKQTLDKIQIKETQEEQKPAVQLKDTFSTPKYLLPLVILSLAQVCNNGFYYTIQYSLDDYGYRFELNMLVIGCIEFGSCIFTNFFCQRMKRKFWIVVLMMLSGGFGLLVQISEDKTLDIVFLAFSRLFNTVGFALFGLISSETFPTAIRSTGLGITEAMSNLGNMAAPFLVTLSQFARVKSVFIGGFLNIGGGLLMLLVKETKIDDVQKQNQIEHVKNQNVVTSENLQSTLLTQQNQKKEE